MKKTNVERVFASLKKPAVLLAYNTEEGVPAKTRVTSYSCSDCPAEVTANHLVVPFCPSCSGTLKQSNNKILSFTPTDFKKMKSVAKCVECATSYVGDTETLAAFKDTPFHCLACTSQVKADKNSKIVAEEDADESDDDDKNKDDDSDVTDVSDDSSSDDTMSDDDSSDDSGDESDDTSDDDSDDSDSDSSDDDDSSDDSSEDDDSTDTSDNSDSGDVDPELDQVLKNLSPDSDSSTTDDTSSTDTTDDTSSDDTSSTDDDSNNPLKKKNDEDSDESDDDDTSSVEAAFFKASLKKAKKFDLVASSGYKKWYLFADDSPLAIAEPENATPDVQKVFPSESYKNAFDSSVQNDGGVNTELLNDFGFTPVSVNVNMDDVTKELVDKEIEEKTAELNDKLEDIAARFDQCVGIAAMGDLKGIYPNKASLRTPLIAKLKAINVRNAERLVDEVLSKTLEGYLKNIVVRATELMNKSDSSLTEVASMVTAAEYRTSVADEKSTDTAVVVPFSVVADTENREKGNLNHTDKVEASNSVLSPDRMRAATRGLRGLHQRR